MPATSFDIDAIAAGGTQLLRFPSGATIYARGEPGDCAFIVTRGRVRIGDAVSLEMVRAGEVFGEASLLDGAPRMASATASGPAEIRVIDRALFEVLMRDDEDFAGMILNLTSRRLRAAICALDRVTGDSRPMLRLVAG